MARMAYGTKIIGTTLAIVVTLAILCAVIFTLRVYTMAQVERNVESAINAGGATKEADFMQSHAKESVECLLKKLELNDRKRAYVISELISSCAYRRWWMMNGRQLGAPELGVSPDVPIIGTEDSEQVALNKVNAIKKWWAGEYERWSANWFPW